MSIHDETLQHLSIPATVLQSTAKAVFEHLTPGSAGAEMGRVCDRLRTKCGWSNADLKKLRELVRNEMIASDALLAIKEQFGK
ncbi:hypothetical protein [Ruegeria arenilitoris]|uniref:hypothetical protein n=1 Tax=Ruegeria arenilitoris TaxID=1173585 RepID=UPI00147F9081|nr:hypothetical protein [Ruegeria arenilitoris]